MNKYYKIFVTVLVLMPLLSFSQQRWEIIIGRPNISETAIDKIETYDKGFCLLNYERWGKISLIKSNINGTVLWEKTILNQENNLTPRSICELNASDLIVTGSAGESGMIIKLNTCGEVEWCIRFENPEYNMISFNDAVILENGDILVLAFLQRVDNNITKQNYLFCFDSSGNYLWKKAYASKDNYPLFGDRQLWNLFQFSNYYLMSGEAYYPYPSDPSRVFLRPFFVRVDSMFDEVFVLPYGVEDSIVGSAFDIKDSGDNSINTGVGGRTLPNTGVKNSFIMMFDKEGHETSSWTISNEDIGPSVERNVAELIINASDSTEILAEFIIDGNIGSFEGELVVDSNYSVKEYLKHENTNPPATNIINTSTNEFLFATSVKELPYVGDYDILLYRLNADLSQTAINTNTYTYDSLCDNLPIVSDTIYLNNCSIVTSIDDVPLPSEYYSYIKTIPINIYPNPASSGITFEFGNTEHHKDIVLKVFDINGQLIFAQELADGHVQINTSVSSWVGGMYIATASSRIGGSGSAKFVKF